MYVISFYDEEGGWMYACIREHQAGFINELTEAIIFVSIKDAMDWWNHYKSQFNFYGINDEPCIRKLVAKTKVKLKAFREEKNEAQDSSV